MTVDLRESGPAGWAKGRSRLWSLSWKYVGAPVFRLLEPDACNTLRLQLLRFFGAEIGANCIVKPTVRIFLPWRISLGDNTWVGDDARLYSMADIRIGANSIISQESFLCTGSHDIRDPHMNLVTRPITVGNGCWICARTFVNPGVNIADGAVVLPATVVTKDVPTHVLFGGNPGRVVKPRPALWHTKAVHDGSH